MNEEKNTINEENYINNTENNKAKYILSILIKDLHNIKYYFIKYFFKLLYICIILSLYSNTIFRYLYNKY